MYDNLLNQKHERSNFIIYAFIALVLILSISLFNSVYVLVRVSGESMENTLYEGDVLYVNKLSEVEHGDVIVVNHPERGMIIKRVIALGGDEIKCEEVGTGDGKVYIKYAGSDEFVMLDEPYLSVTTPTIAKQKIEEGYLFILGDNRSNSTDSASYGAIKSEYVVGVVSQRTINNKKILTKLFGWTFKLVELFGGEL